MSIRAVEPPDDPVMGRKCLKNESIPTNSLSRRFFQMNKGELVHAVTDKAKEQLGESITKKEVDAVISAAIDCIMEVVAEGEKVTLVGFGSFEARERKEREGRNPKTGDKMLIPATKVPAFSAGKMFKDKVAPEKK
ncbi:DNA binding protein HU [Synechocystis sp. PCC 6803]|nr:DNA binding protein HU [Synechocystis sp. PCC 6803]BAA17458.1 DNA binding protein HU [Synechocystis sp. PCC 6803]